MASQVCLVLALIVCLASAEIQLKHRAGPPSEFSNFAPIDTADYPDVQHSTSIKVNLIPDAKFTDSLVQTVPLVVDSKNEFRFGFFSPHSSLIELTLSNPKGGHVPIKGTESYIPVGDEQIPGVVYTIQKPMQGEYQLQLKTAALDAVQFQLLTSNSNADAYIIAWNEDAYAIHTTVNTYATVTGRKVGLVTRIIDSSLKSAAQAVKGIEQSATMYVEFPDGDTVQVAMQDDGLTSDGTADDGIFGALITAPVAGHYIFQATIQGINSAGIRYTRSTTQAVTVIDQTLSLTGAAEGVIDPVYAHRLVANIEVSAPIGQQYYAYAEVWGKDSSGDDVPVSWIGGMTQVQRRGGIVSVPLELDLNWVSMAGAKEPLTLRNVVVSDPNHFIPMATSDEISVSTSFELSTTMSSLSLNGAEDDITDEMRQGVKPANNHTKRAPTTYLLLVHGYCSSSNPWTTSTWRNGKFYLDPSKSVLNDVFAQNVIKWASNQNLESYAFIGHSQGGMIGLHMYEFYWSGLDYITGGRKIQSVGTPYQGCSMAGDAATLGKVFGVGCGINDNLKVVGATAWLKTISAVTRKEAYFYTTTYKQGQLFGDWCNLAANLILEFPNDGTTEFIYAGLPGGNSMGNVEGQCHIRDMKYPAQYDDTSRNKVMSNNAANVYLP